MATYRTGSAGAKVTTAGAAITAGVAPAVGETLFLVGVTRAASATVSTAAGWSLIGAAAMTNGTAFLHYLVATSTTNSFTTPTYSAASQLQYFITGIVQGIDPVATTFDGTHLASSSGSTSPVTIPSLSGGVNGGICICLFGMSRGATLTFTTYVEDVDGNTGTGTTNSTLGGGHLELTSSGATPTGSVAHVTAGNYGILTAAIDPAVVPSTAPPQRPRLIRQAVNRAAVA